MHEERAIRQRDIEREVRGEPRQPSNSATPGPPSNRLEKLKGNRVGQRSIRVNDQWRICFRWKDGNAYDVEIVDCH